VERRCPLRRLVVFAGARRHLQPHGWRGGGRGMAANSGVSKGGPRDSWPPPFLALSPTRSGLWRSLHVGPRDSWDGGAMRSVPGEILGRLS
jgi:hypothetical protein